MWESRESVGAPRAHGKHSNHRRSDFSHTTLDDDTGFLCTCFHPSLRTKWTASSSATQQKGLSNSFKRLKTLCGLQWPALTCGRWESWLYYSYTAGPVSQVRERESRWNGADLEAPSPAAVEMHPAEHVRHTARVRPSTCSGGVVRVSVPECMLSPMFIFLTQLESDCQSQSFVRKELRHIDCRCTPPFSPQYFSFFFFYIAMDKKKTTFLRFLVAVHTWQALTICSISLLHQCWRDHRGGHVLQAQGHHGGVGSPWQHGHHRRQQPPPQSVELLHGAAATHLKGNGRPGPCCGYSHVLV